MKTKTITSIALIGVLLLGVGESFAQSGWISQTCGTSQQLFDVTFTDANTGTAVGVGATILRTINGGATWTPQPNDGNMWLGVSFANATTGIVVGKGATINRTTDGGASWVKQTSSVSSGDDFFRVVCIGTNTAFIAGSQEILRTINGGATWVKVKAANFATAVAFANANVGIVTTASGGIYRTADGGDNWTFKSVTTDGLLGVCFCSSTTAIAVGDRGSIWRTTDAGTTWSQSSGGTTGSFWSISASGSAAVAVGDSGTIVRSIDAGLTWTTQMCGKSYGLNGVFFINPTTGIAVGDKGTVLRTTNGGVTSVEEGSRGQLPSQVLLNQNYPNPFNPTTTISYSLPKSAIVSLRIFDALGQEVAILESGIKEAGSHQSTWNANVSSGIYFYRLQAGGFVETKKMMLIR